MKHSSEAAIQVDIMHAFGSRPEIRLWRINVVGARTAAGRLIRSAPKGHADLAGILWPTGRAIYIEVKSSKGKLSTQQRRFGDMILRMGGIWVCAKSVQDVERAISAANDPGAAQGPK